MRKAFTVLLAFLAIGTGYCASQGTRPPPLKLQRFEGIEVGNSKVLRRAGKLPSRWDQVEFSPLRVQMLTLTSRLKPLD